MQIRSDVFFCKVANKQTDKQRRKHNLLGEGNKKQQNNKDRVIVKFTRFDADISVDVTTASQSELSEATVHQVPP